MEWRAASEVAGRGGWMQLRALERVDLIDEKLDAVFCLQLL